MDNLKYYNMGREVPQEAKKNIGGGRLKGMTDINPMWRIKKLTEMFGVCGIGWKYENGELIEPILPIEVPQTITPRQLRLHLLAIELLDEVEALCSADRAMSIWFEYSLDFQRSHPMIEAMAVQLGLTQNDMDTFFIEASKL